MHHARQNGYQLGAAGSLGFTLAICTLLGLAGGHFLDRRLDTAPAFTIGLLLLGSGLGFFNMIHYGLARGGRER